MILSELGATSAQLGLCQMVATALFGALKVWSMGDRRVDDRSKSRQTRRQLRLTLVMLASLRMTSVILGLVSLKHVPASFTETIKSTAPLFTVYLQHLVLGVRTSPQVLASLVPVMAGLVVCAQAEVAFNAVGFWAAVTNNVIDCLQNVVSKKTLDSLSPVHLQFYTSALALVFQIPLLVVRELEVDLSLDPHTWDPAAVASTAHQAWQLTVQTIFASRTTLAYFVANVACYHAQSISAYFVVANLTPVSVSVANTLKRSLLIALSVAYFGNQMTVASVLGVCIVVAGVFGYNRARVKYPADDVTTRPRVAKAHPSDDSE